MFALELRTFDELVFVVTKRTSRFTSGVRYVRFMRLDAQSRASVGSLRSIVETVRARLIQNITE